MSPAAAASERSRGERLGWALLGLLLLVLTVAAARVDRSQWPSFVGDEATYLMAAESLAWDLDLRYERRDFDRFQEHWNRPPEGLILQSGDGGRTLVFGKPFFYPLFLAPFARWSPTHGPFVANALLLAVAAWLAATRLRSPLGPAAPWWTAAFLFASVTFTYTFWAHADLFLLSLTAIALALALGKPSRPLPWAVVGVLLAVVVFSRPIYAPLFLPAVLALPGRTALRAALGLMAGTAVLCAATISVHQATASTWTSYGGERGGFYSWTGFPLVDFPADGWDEAIHRSGNVAWGSWLLKGDRSGRATGDRKRLAGWNLLYLLAGRNVGLLPYYLPLLLGLLALPRGRVGWALLLAVVVSLGSLLVLRPFNFYGGGAAIANRYFLPLYPAFWFLASRRRSPAWAVVAALLAVPFLWPLWLQGSSYPTRDDLTWRYPAPVAQGWLPYETTQSHLKPSGQEDQLHNGLWIKLLTPRIRVLEQGGFALPPGRGGELLVGRGRPLDSLELTLLPASGAALPRIAGADAVPTGDGRTFLIELETDPIRHPMWWTPGSFYLYRLRFSFEGATEPVLFSLRAVHREDGRR